ncbi:MAG TPA: hypothetical protein VFN88_03255 [Caulobacteraceae bacterium]|nr:hypothetical protein [Caulobacteraceae bacterium]
MTRVLSFLADVVDAATSLVEHLTARPDRFSRTYPALADRDHEWPASRYLGHRRIDR